MKFSTLSLLASGISAVFAMSGSGRMTFYGNAGECPSERAIPSCGLVDFDTQYYVAMNHEQYDSTLSNYANPNSAAVCNTCIKVTYNGRSVIGKVIDKCPSCAAGAIDVSLPLFRKLADPDLGVVNVSWETTSCSGLVRTSGDACSLSEDSSSSFPNVKPSNVTRTISKKRSSSSTKKSIKTVAPEHEDYEYDEIEFDIEETTTTETETFTDTTAFILPTDVTIYSTFSEAPTDVPIDSESYLIYLDHEEKIAQQNIAVAKKEKEEARKERKEAKQEQVEAKKELEEIKKEKERIEEDDEEDEKEIQRSEKNALERQANAITREKNANTRINIANKMEDEALDKKAEIEKKQKEAVSSMKEKNAMGKGMVAATSIVGAAAFIFGGVTLKKHNLTSISKNQLTNESDLVREVEENKIDIPSNQQNINIDDVTIDITDAVN
ncbi:hypothetical protein U3516DRAFT_836988 [Neocallimastix sp. 'constans']